MAIVYEKLIRLMKMFIMVLVLVAVQVQQSMQLKNTHPLREVVDKINLQGPYIGLGLAFPYEAIPLLESRLFVPNSNYPVVQLAGRKFNIGKIKGVDVIYVITGDKGVNAAIGIHTLLQSFNVRGVVWYGIAGCANTSMSIGDVGVATSFAFTSSWRWPEYGAPDTDPREFKFGSYNLPKAGDNLLERILPEPVKILIDGKPVEERFWFSVDPHWYNLATKLQKVKLQQCVNETKCLPYVPKITFGLKGSTSDVFMSNAAYAEYLLNKHGVSIIDEESAAVVHASQTNGVPCIVFRGISDVAGKQHIDVAGISAVAATNSFKVALKFMQLIGKEYNYTS